MTVVELFPGAAEEREPDDIAERLETFERIVRGEQVWRRGKLRRLARFTMGLGRSQRHSMSRLLDDYRAAVNSREEVQDTRFEAPPVLQG